MKAVVLNFKSNRPKVIFNSKFVIQSNNEKTEKTRGETKSLIDDLTNFIADKFGFCYESSKILANDVIGKHATGHDDVGYLHYDFEFCLKDVNGYNCSFRMIRDADIKLILLNTLDYETISYFSLDFLMRFARDVMLSWDKKFCTNTTTKDIAWEIEKKYKKQFMDYWIKEGGEEEAFGNHFNAYDGTAEEITLGGEKYWAFVEC